MIGGDSKSRVFSSPLHAQGYIGACAHTHVYIFYTMFVDTGGKFLFIYFYFFLYTDPHLASVCVCVLYLFSISRYELCVCGNMCTCVRVSTNLESPPTMGNFKVWLGTYV